MISIRPATEQDASSIACVHVQSWQTSYAGIVPQAYLNALNVAERERLWREWLTSDVSVFVADLEGRSGRQIVGFICGSPARERLQDCDAELFAIYLLQSAQRQGIGRALLRALVKSLQQKGFKSMGVWALENNSATRFYEKSGALATGLKEVEIGGAMLPVRGYSWSDLTTIAS